MDQRSELELKEIFIAHIFRHVPASGKNTATAEKSSAIGFCEKHAAETCTFVSGMQDIAVTGRCPLWNKVRGPVKRAEPFVLPRPFCFFLGQCQKEREEKGFNCPFHFFLDKKVEQKIKPVRWAILR